MVTITEVLNELIIKSTITITNGGWPVGFILVLLESFIPILPLGAFITININAFGFFKGLIISWSATTIGSFITFLIFSYLSNKKIFNYFIKNKKELLTEKEPITKDMPMIYLVLLITLPFIPSFLINIMAGFTKISKEKYLISLIIGKALMTSFWSYVGVSIIESIMNNKSIIFILNILLIAYLITKIISKKFKLE